MILVTSAGAGPVEMEIPVAAMPAQEADVTSTDWSEVLTLNPTSPVNRQPVAPSPTAADSAATHVLIPLPAPLWSGMAGLGAMAVVGIARKIRRAM
jgi:hypothetical protein